MNTKTPPAPAQGTGQSSGSLLPTTRRGPAGLDEDLRRFMTLNPLEQLERLEADGERIKRREREMRAAERKLSEEVKP